MALNTQYIPIPLANGIDTKTDDKLVQPPFLRRLINGVTGKTGKVKKRPGYDILGSNVVAGSAISSGEALGTFQNELLLFNQSTAYSYSEQFDAYQNRGRVSPVLTSADSVYQSSLNVRCADFDSTQNIYLYAFQDMGTADLYAQVIDSLTGSVLMSPVKINTNQPITDLLRVVAQNGYIYIFYADTVATSLKYRRLNLANPTTLEAETAVPSGGYGGICGFDAVAIDTTRIAIAFQNGASKVTFGVFSGAISVPTFSVDTTTVSEVCSGLGFNLFVEPTSQNVWVVYFRDTNLLRYFIYATTLSVVLSPTNAQAAALPRAVGITGEFNSSTQLQLIYQTIPEFRAFVGGDVTPAADTISLPRHRFQDGQQVDFTGGGLPAGITAGTPYFVIVVDANTIKVAASLNNALIGTPVDITGAGAGTIRPQQDLPWASDIRLITLNQSGSIGTFSTLNYGCDLRSKAFKYNSTIYFLVGLVRATQFVYFLMDTSGNVISKAHQDKAMDDVYAAGSSGSASNMLSKMIQSSSGIWEFAAVVKTSVKDPDGGTGSSLAYRNGIKLTTFDFTSEDKYYSEEISKNALISGGYMSAYDGVLTQELGFYAYPENFLAGVLAGAGTNFLVTVIYEWQDAQGNLFQSAVPLTQTLSTAATPNIAVIVPNLFLTNKTSAALPVKIALYMSEGGGSLLYKVKTVSNSTSAAYQKITFNTAINTSNVGLYTDSGEVDNVQPPAAAFIARNKNRVAIINAEDRKEVWFSKYVFGDNAVNFSDGFTKRLDGYGDIVGIAPMDDKWIVWTDKSIHYWSGDGPDDTGGQDTFTDIQLVTTDTGLADANSIVTMPSGLMYKSNKGPYLLGRNLQNQYIGAPTEEFNTNPVTAAVLIEDSNEVLMTSGSGNPTLSYDYYQNNWSTFENHDVRDAVNVQGVLHYLKNGTAQVYRRNDGFKDGSTTYPLKVETAWIKLSSIQNFQRVRRAIFVGNFKSDHQLKISIYYDYRDGVADIVTWDAASVLNSSVIGDETLLGDDSLLGGTSDDVYQVSVHIPRQKCEAIKFVIEDVNAGDLNESYELTHIQLECGIKQGVYRIPSEKTAGS